MRILDVLDEPEQLLKRRCARNMLFSGERDKAQLRLLLSVRV